MGTCAVCGAGLGPDARFCASCGAPVVVACPSCGATLTPGDRFCSRCGQTVPTRPEDAAGPGPAQPSFAAGGEERKLVTVLFADITGSTVLADHLDPERLRGVMRRYFDAMREEIEAQGGTVEKFIGDAVMAAFGVPTAHEDDASRALRAADAMRRRLGSVNDELVVSHGLTLRMRMGVNTGEVLAATSPEPGGAMVTGDVVNVAARLQTAAEPDEVLVSERTAQSARGFAFTERGTLDLRGRRMPVRAFRLTGEVGGPARGVPYLRAPMVGRDAELTVLDSVYARTVEESRPHVVTIYGDAGVGKSRLVQEFVDRVQDRDPGPLVLRGRCLPYGTGVTYWPLAEMLKAYAAIQDTDSATETLDKIDVVATKLEDLGTGDAQHTAAILAYTVGVHDPRTPTEAMDPQEVRRQVHVAWRAFFSALATSGPVLVIVEDIHWGDAALLDLLDELAERTQGAVLFVCPSRPELVATRPTWGGGRRNAITVSLDPLGSDDAELLVRLLLSVEDLPAALHARILERAEGNPFFLEEILRRLIDGGLVTREGGRWRAQPGIAEVDLPDSVQGVLAARIDLLHPEDKRALQAAAVVGRVFWGGPVHRLTSGRAEPVPFDAELDQSLRHLEDRELVRHRVGSSFARQQEYIFKHILTRDVAYDTIPLRDRGVAHAQVGEWLEQVAGERAGEFCELLAHHYGTALRLARQNGAEPDPALRESAVRWLLRASNDALRKFVLDKAEQFAHEALASAADDVERCDALAALGHAYQAEVQGDLAWQYFVEAADVAAGCDEIPDLRTAHLLALACDQALRWPGTMNVVVPEAEVRARRDRGLALVGPGDSAERANLLAISASWPFAYPGSSPGSVDSYAAQGLEAVDIALRLGDGNLASACLDAAASAYCAVGDFRRAMQLFSRRWDLRDRITSDLELVDLYAMGAWMSWEIGDYLGAVRFGEGIEDWNPHPSTVHAQAWRVAALFRLGRWDEALAVYARSLDTLGARRDSPANAVAHLYAVAVLIHDLRDERRDAGSAANVVAAVPEHSMRIYPWRIRLALQRSDLDRARALLEAPPASWKIHAGIVWEVRCEDVLARGEWDRGDQVAAAAREHADAVGARALGPAAQRLEGVVVVARGDAKRGVERLVAARDGFDALGMVWEVARTRRLLAVAYARSGRSDEAATETAAATRSLDALGVVTDPVLDAALAAL
jgi:class 3 adenylate cyclase/tetratricopeptide (TPR) repeat protein